jgi:hypothetical protein
MKQPEALRLADALDDEFTQGRISNHNGRKAAVELRRLHEVNQDLLKALHEALETEQEPVAWMFVNEDGECEQIEYGPVFDDSGVTPLYTAPPKREWVGLHGSEVPDPYKYDVMFNEGWWWAEEKLKEKNHG